MWKRILTEKLNKFCNKQLSKLLEFPCFKMLKTQLGSKATWLRFEVNPALSQALEYVTSRVPSNLNHSVML